MKNRNVFILPDPTSETTASGIYLPASLQDKERENIGTVLRAGEGTEHEPVLYKKGDRVMYDPHAGAEYNIDDQDVRIVVDTDIYLTIKN